MVPVGLSIFKTVAPGLSDKNMADNIVSSLIRFLLYTYLLLWLTHIILMGSAKGSGFLLPLIICQPKTAGSCYHYKVVFDIFDLDIPQKCPFGARTIGREASVIGIPFPNGCQYMVS